jgi:hypothetical protein
MKVEICKFLQLVIVLSAVGLLVLGCESNGVSGKSNLNGSFFRYNPVPEEPPYRPGTTSVRIKAPIIVPPIFQILQGLPIKLNAWKNEFDGDEVVVSFHVPVDGGLVEDVEASYLKHKGFKERVVDVVKTWSYSSSMSGRITITIKLSSKTIGIDTDLQKTGNYKPQIGWLYNAE